MFIENDKVIDKLLLVCLNELNIDMISVQRGSD